MIIGLTLGTVMSWGTITDRQTTSSQETSSRVISDRDIELFRKDLRSKRKQVVAANIKMTDAEATKFWPIYDQYASELIQINNKKFALIQDYADNFGKLTDEQSLSIVRQWLDEDIATAQLRQKYVPIVSKVLDGRTSASFFQIDRRIAMMLELQVSSRMPLVQDQ